MTPDILVSFVPYPGGFLCFSNFFGVLSVCFVLSSILRVGVRRGLVVVGVFYCALNEASGFVTSFPRFQAGLILG